MTPLYPMLPASEFTRKILKPFSGVSGLPLSHYNRLDLDYKYLVPESHPSFHHALPFIAQMINMFASLPEMFGVDSQLHIGCDPFEFINFKQVKKTLFRRLITKKTESLV
jgi:hypothetical protein